MYKSINDEIVKLYYSDSTILEGNVYISGVISPIGELANIKVEKTFSKKVAEQLVEQLKRKNDWIPGYLNGEPEYSRIILPFKYTMKK